MHHRSGAILSDRAAQSDHGYESLYSLRRDDDGDDNDGPLACKMNLETPPTQPIRATVTTYVWVLVDVTGFRMTFSSTSAGSNGSLSRTRTLQWAMLARADGHSGGRRHETLRTFTAVTHWPIVLPQAMDNRKQQPGTCTVSSAGGFVEIITTKMIFATPCSITNLGMPGGSVSLNIPTRQLESGPVNSPELGETVLCLYR